MSALPPYARYWASKMWADLPEKTTPIIAASLRHWDDWHALTRNRVEELAGLLAALDSGTSAALATKADKATAVNAGTGLNGGGDLSASRTLSVDYGTSSTTATRGDDTRVVNALQAPVSGPVAKADLLVGLASGLLDRLPVGAAGSSLIADSTQPLGIRWGTPSMDGLSWSAWTTLTLASGYGLSTPANDVPLAYRARGDEVQLRGGITCNANLTGVTIATLPVAARPRGFVQCHRLMPTTTGTVNMPAAGAWVQNMTLGVRADGAVVISTGPGTTYTGHLPLLHYLTA